MNLYQLYKSSSEIEMEKLLLIPKKKKKQIQPCGPPMHGSRRHGPRVRQPMMGEAGAQWRFCKRDLGLISNYTETHNSIPMSLWRIHLTPWVFPNSLAHTLGNSVHGGAASGGTGWLCRPPRTCVSLSNGSIAISNLDDYAKQRWGMAELTGEGCSGARLSTTVAQRFRWTRIATGLTI